MFVEGDRKLCIVKFVAAPAGEVSRAGAASAPTTVDANAPNCDIEVDGSFTCNTPSTLNLAAGKHDIVVTKTGYDDWTLSLIVGRGSVHLNAEMVAK